MNRFNYKNILVAGGTGLLGTSLTKRFSKFKNVKLTSTFCNSKPQKNLSKYYKKYDFLKWDNCLNSTKNKDLVIICAVRSGGIKYMKENPTESMLDNIKIRSNLFEACSINNVKKVIWVSSSTIYPIKKKPIKESEMDYNKKTYDDYIITGSVYRFVEKLADYYITKKNLNLCVIRVTSIYGPNDNFSDHYSHVVPALIKKIINEKKALKVWGDKQVTRDFVYVEDLSQAIEKIVVKKKNLSPINFSSGKATKILQLVNLLTKITKKNLKIKFVNKSLSSAPYRVLDNSKFNKIFKSFKRTPLKKGLEETITWYVKNEKKK